MARSHTFTHLQGTEVVVQADHVLPGAVLGQQYVIGRATDHGGEILQGHVAVERVDADHQLLVATPRRPGVQILASQAARLRFPGQGDGILQIQDQAIGIGTLALGDLFFAVGGQKQHGAHWQPSPLRPT